MPIHRLALLIGLLAGACSSPTDTRKVGELIAQVHRDTAQLGIFDGSAKLLLLSQPQGLELGSGSVTWEYQFGAFQQLESAATVRAATRFGAVTQQKSGISFAVQHGDEALGDAQLETVAPGHAVLRVSAKPGTAATRSAHRIRFSFACRPTEHFLGFGGQSWDVDHRGQKIPIWVSEDGIGKTDTDLNSPGYFLVGKKHATHTPMPIYLSSAGYGVVVNTPAYATFDLCATDKERVTIEVWDDHLELHLFSGPTPIDLLAKMTEHLGRPKVPPAFTWAPWLDAIFGSANVRRVAQKLRDVGVASAVIWTEDWRGGYLVGDGTYALEEQWELSRALYPDFESVAADLHALGFKLLTYHNTFLDLDSPTFAEAAALGHTIKNAAGAPLEMVGIRFLPTTLADLTSPAARAWIKDKIKTGFAQGADGHMADFAEWLPPDAVLASGEDAQLHHNAYPVEWARLNAETVAEQQALDGIERLFFVRAAHLGSQSLVSVVWAGDQQTDWLPGDGFPSVIPMGIGLGIAGFPYFAHDIAGYMSQTTTPVDRELWYRWVTFGALSPVMRTHHGRDVEHNWNWESDVPSTQHLARWARLHMRLFPYLSGLARRAAATGEPMFGPLALQHPDFEPGWTKTDQYLLGDRVYVAPVVTRGATTRTVALPEGTYHPLLGGAPVVVGKIPEAQLDVPLTEIVALVRPGTLVPLLPADVDTTEPTTSVKHLDQAGDDRELWLWGGGASTFDEGNGLTYDWRAWDWTGPIGDSTFNGQPVSYSSLSTGEVAFELAGPGELLIRGGQAVLKISGGSAARKTRLLIRP